MFDPAASTNEGELITLTEVEPEDVGTRPTTG
jgi:hypothetical protein